MDNSSSKSRIDIASLPPLTVGNLVLALMGLPLVVVLLSVTNTDLDTIYTMGLHWALALIVLGIAVRGEGLSLHQLGFRRPSLLDIGYIIVTSIAIIFVYSATPPLIEALGLPTSESSGLVGGSTGFGVAIAYAVTIGIVEEVLYRGYPIERLLAYTDSSLIAGGGTWFVFTAAHAVNWPVGSLIQTSLVAAVLTAVYLRRRTLAPVVGARFSSGCS